MRSIELPIHINPKIWIGINVVAPPGNQAENGENEPQPVALGETGLLD